ncbi:MAG: hypothetical protein RR334_03525 [Clostridia bacterium]
MIVDFEDKTHAYSVDGDIADISITELLSKHGLAPDYSKVKELFLSEKADIGKEVHKDLENVLNCKGYIPKTTQGENFDKWVKENLDCGVGEQVIAYRHGSLIIAGTIDVMAISKAKEVIIADHKNTSLFNREYVTWQVSLSDYFARKLGTEKINGKLLDWHGATQFKCFQYEPKTGEMKIKELQKIPDEEIEKILDCELNNTIYQRPKLIIDNELQEKFVRAEEEFAKIETEYKLAEENLKQTRDEICELLAKQGKKSWEDDDGRIKVTYIEPSERVSIDSKMVKEKYPQIFSECQKLTNVKASIRVAVNNDD